MAGTAAHDSKQTGRRLKLHKKSRQGCGNCKTRKVKVWPHHGPLGTECVVRLSAYLQCDESKPVCKRCTMYGTFCNYEPQYSELQPLAHGALDFQSLRTPLCSENQTILAVINGPKSPQLNGSTRLINGGDRFSGQYLELLHKFHTRTILTLGTAQFKPIYQNAYAKLVYSVCQVHSVFLRGA